MSIWMFGILCAVCIVAEFYLAGLAFEKNFWSPAIILAVSMAFCGIVCSVLTYNAIFWR